jgi:hypothetical protein
LREYIERSSGERWHYSGEVDLVLVNGWLAKESDPTIDWVSTLSGQLTDQTSGAKTLTLASVIEPSCGEAVARALTHPANVDGVSDPAVNCAR